MGLVIKSIRQLNKAEQKIRDNEKGELFYMTCLFDSGT
jgi:hypothetical protein